MRHLLAVLLLALAALPARAQPSPAPEARPISIVVPFGSVTGDFHCIHSLGTPDALRTRSATSRPCSSRRVTSVMCAAPAHAISTAIARPAPPAPSITTRWPFRGAIFAIAYTTPLPSLLGPVSRPSLIVM